MGIEDHPTAARSPWQNEHAERLIGSIRRECGETNLRRILAGYTAYYNGFRPHLPLNKDPSGYRPVQRFGQVAARPILGGLHHRYCRIWISVRTRTAKLAANEDHARLAEIDENLERRA